MKKSAINDEKENRSFIKKLIEEFMNQLPSFLCHSFNMHHQQRVLSEKIEKMKKTK